MENLLATKNEVDLDAQPGNTPQRAYVCRVPTDRFPHPCDVEKCDLPIAIKYVKGAPTNDQRTRALFYKAIGKYLRGNRTNIGLTPI